MAAADPDPDPEARAARRSGGDELRSSGMVSTQVDRIERRLSQKEPAWVERSRNTQPPLTPPVGGARSGGAALPTTPVIQRSPPTPDHTPPKLPPSGVPSSGSHQTSLAGSFITAHEQLSAEQLPTPIGLGLGLETPDGLRTPTAAAPHIIGDTHETWHDDILDDPFAAPESLAVRAVDKPAAAAGALDFQASLEAARRSPSLHSLLDIDPKRLSDVSAGSQVVPAIVIATPRRKRQRLRHASKNASLRTASSPADSSPPQSSHRSSVASAELRPRPLHRPPRGEAKRVSQNSDSGISMGSDPRPVPPPELLGRMSSLRRSSAKERALSRRYSDLTRDQEPDQRPVTAPEAAAATAAAAPASPQYTRSRRTADYPPVVPPRGSSLSAPTSRNNSRTTSMTSAPTLQAARPTAAAATSTTQPARLPEPGTPRTRRPPEFLMEPADERRNSEDRFSARRRSMLATPFSAVSGLSSTPGPFEVNEATAINIFPHNNASLLVVQQAGAALPTAMLAPGVRLPPAALVRAFSPLRNPRPAPAPAPVHAPAPAPVVLLTPPTPANAWSAPSRTNSVRRALSGRRHTEGRDTAPARPLVERPRTKMAAAAAAAAAVSTTRASPLWRPRAFWQDVDGATDGEDDPYVRNTLGLPQRRFIAGPGSLSRRIGSLRRRRAAAAAGPIADVESRVGILARLRGGRPVRPFASLAEAIASLRLRHVERRREKQRDRLRRHIGPVILPAAARPFGAHE